MNSLFRGGIGLFILMLVGGCSPISNHMDELKVVEDRIKRSYYTKRNDSLIESVKKLSEKKAYKALVTDETLKSYRETLLKDTAHLKKSAIALRAINDESYNDATISKGNRAADVVRKADISLRVSQRLVQRRFDKLASMVEQRQKQDANLKKSHAEFIADKTKLYASIAAASERHPRQNSRLGGFVKVIDSFENDYQKLLGFFKREPFTLSFEDYNGFINLYNKAKIEDAFPLSLVKDYQRMLGQLDLSYSKVLMDINESHSVLMGSMSWDNYYDYPTEHTQKYSYIEVSHAQQVQIASRFGSGSAYSTSSLRDSKLLNLATKGQSARANNFPSGDDEAEVWVEDSESEYTHEYTVIIDGKPSRIEESVTRAMYLKYKDAIGKEIFSKPYGYFEDEAFDEPVNVGESFVGNPAYGQWVKDPSTGIDAWQWIAGYVVLDSLLGGNRYDRGSYNNRRSYYSSYTPMSSRSRGGGLANQYGVIPATSPMSKGITNGRRGQTLGGSGSNFRNRGPGKGK
jgi:hypothetical protein